MNFRVGKWIYSPTLLLHWHSFISLNVQKKIFKNSGTFVKFHVIIHSKRLRETTNTSVRIELRKKVKVILSLGLID
jgi:hypothetical protein